MFVNMLLQWAHTIHVVIDQSAQYHLYLNYTRKGCTFLRVTHVFKRFIAKHKTIDVDEIDSSIWLSNNFGFEENS